MIKLWKRLFLDERPSIGLSFFRIFVALTAGFHVIPSFFCLGDNYFHSAFKVLNYDFFTPQAIDLVQRSPDAVVVFFVATFLCSWLFFLVGLFSQISGIVLMACCYYFYALNSFPIGTLSWDILLVTLFLMCLTPYHGDYFSIDSLFKGNPDAYKKKRPFFIQGLLQMQIAFTYFYTGLYKITASGNWWSGNPVYYLMNSPPEGVMKYFLLKDFLAVHPVLCYWLGITITVIELSMPGLLYWPKTRLSAIYLGFLFHIVLILTMDVPAIFFFLFPAQLLLFIPPEDILRWIERRREFNRRGGQHLLVFDGHCQFCQASVRQLAVMDLFGVLAYVDYQKHPHILSLHSNLTHQRAHSQLHLIGPEGWLRGGFDVFRYLSLKLPMLYPLILLFYFPGSGVVGPIIYRWVSRNRYLFHAHKICRDNACFVQ